MDGKGECDGSRDGESYAAQGVSSLSFAQLLGLEKCPMRKAVLCNNKLIIRHDANTNDHNVIYLRSALRLLTAGKRREQRSV